MKTGAAFKAAIKRYRALVDKTAAVPGLAGCVRRLVEDRDGPSYTVKTPVVYNGALDEEGALDGIRMILVGDNPGRREQENSRYLVGPSGKIAEKFFRDRPELGIDFRKHVLILNKTPIHTPRTAELKELCRIGGKDCAEAVRNSQEVMAELLVEFRQAALGAMEGGSLPPGLQAPLSGAPPSAGRSETALAQVRLTASRAKVPQRGAEIKPLSPAEALAPRSPATPRIPVWIIGYSEMKKGGIFEAYTEKLKTLCAADPAFKAGVFFFRHFSMNQFTADLKQQALPGETAAQSLERIGAAYRKRVLGN